MNRKRLVAALALASATLGVVKTAVAQVELKNDGFTGTTTPNFQGGLMTGEIAAVRLVAPSTGMQVTQVRLVFGGDASTRTFRVHIWNDSAGTTAPGTELYTGDHSLAGMPATLQDIDLTSVGVILPITTFRVGIEFLQDGLPSVATDADGTITASGNFINVSGLGWSTSQSAGFTQDWIIRAVVAPVSPADAATGSDAAAVDASDGASTDASDAAATDGPPAPTDGGGDTGAAQCQVNSDCPSGRYCQPTAKTCTFDCRLDSDCNAGTTCNSLGMCVARSGGVSSGGGDDGGCGCRVEQTTGARSALALELAAAAIALVRRRRRADRRR